MTFTKGPQSAGEAEQATVSAPPAHVTHHQNEPAAALPPLPSTLSPSHLRGQPHGAASSPAGMPGHLIILSMCIRGRAALCLSKCS